MNDNQIVVPTTVWLVWYPALIRQNTKFIIYTFLSFFPFVDEASEILICERRSCFKHHTTAVVWWVWGVEIHEQSVESEKTA